MDKQSIERGIIWDKETVIKNTFCRFLVKTSIASQIRKYSVEVFSKDFNAWVVIKTITANINKTKDNNSAYNKCLRIYKDITQKP